MIERLDESSGHVIGFRIHGKLTKEDYTDLFVPELEKVIRKHGKGRLLLLMKHFEGWTLGGAWEDFFNAPKFFSIKRMAVVVSPAHRTARRCIRRISSVPRA